MTDPTSAQRQPEPDVDDILQLAAIIRKVDGNNSLGAAALAEEILSHPHSRWTADRAALSQPEPAGLSDEELMELMPQQFRDDLATVSRMAAHGAGPDVGAGLFRVSLNTGALEFARAAIAADRAQRQPVPVSEWRTIDTAPKDGTEILASDYDAVEILSWRKGRFELGIPGEWISRDGQAFFPAWWQPLADHPALPLPGEVEE